MNNWITTIFSAGQVQRCHTMNHHGSYNLAEHSYYAVMIAKEIMDSSISPESQNAIINYLLIHDLHELETGDIPHPFKKRHEHIAGWLKSFAVDWRTNNIPGYWGVVELTEKEYAIAKMADYLELMRWCAQQNKLGSNNGTHHMFDKARSIVISQLDNAPSCTTEVHFLIRILEELINE